jgi:hypothetical protein
MPRVLWISLVALLVAYAAGVTAVLVFDDHRYHTVVFAPIPGNGWHEPSEFKLPSCDKTRKDRCTVTTHTYPDCSKFNPIQCWVYPNRGVAYPALEYVTDDLKIQVEAVDIGLPGHLEDLARHHDEHPLEAMPPPNHASFVVVVTAKKGAPNIDVKQIRLVGPCGPDVPIGSDGTSRADVVPFYEFSMSATTGRLVEDPVEKFRAQINFPSNRATLRECTLRLGNAVKSASGEKIPDVTFRAISVARYDPITFD